MTHVTHVHVVLALAPVFALFSALALAIADAHALALALKFACAFMAALPLCITFSIFRSYLRSRFAALIHHECFRACVCVCVCVCAV